GGGEAVDFGDVGVGAPRVEVVQPGPYDVRGGVLAGAGQQGAEFFFGDPGGQDLPGRVVGEQLVPHLRQRGRAQSLAGSQQPTPVGPLGVDLAAAAVAQLPGDAPPDRGDRVVGQADQVEMVHDELGVG